jgi:hypothetical protein
MPIPDGVELQEPQTKEWPLIPADVYQVEITDIEYKEVDNKWKQKTTDPDKKQVMVFEFTIIDEGPHYGPLLKVLRTMTPSRGFGAVDGAAKKTFMPRRDRTSEQRIFSFTRNGCTLEQKMIRIDMLLGAELSTIN